MILYAFGVNFDLRFPTPELTDGRHRSAAAPVITVSLAERAELSRRWSGPPTPAIQGRAQVDGSGWVAAQGRQGDLQMSHRLADFHLDARHENLTCYPADAGDPAWRRLLFDTCMVTCALARGREALHACAVAVNDRAIAFTGMSGAGKTTIAAEFLTRGALLLTDDVLALGEDSGGRILGYPGPPLMNLPSFTDPDPASLTLARFGDELWVRVGRSQTEACPLDWIVVLDRGEADESPVLGVMEQPAIALLRHALHSGASDARRAARFKLVAALARQARTVRVSCGVDTPPGVLADLVERTITNTVEGEC